MDERLLDAIHGPDDLKKVPENRLPDLADEIRREIVCTLSANGGHLASNLGVVELTIALHRVFHTPEDCILWDVGHQSYPHKLLTGRADRFRTIRKTDGLSGFTHREESPYDSFGAGHAGTAISAAMGFSAASELSATHRHVVSVVGDGSLICGISLEALNNLRCTCKNLILVLNDNKMSISQSIGAIPNYLNQIITGRNYNRFKALAKMMVNRLPGGSSLIGSIQNLEASLKNLFVPGIFFEELGIRYVGPIDGHKLPDLIKTFERVKEFNRPVLVHVVTEKGRGCNYASASPEKFHGIGKFHPDTGESISSGSDSFSAAFGRTLLHLTENDPKVVAVTAAMAAGCGISPEYMKKFQDRFFDVGIAEEHAVVFAAGLAAAGYRPIVAIYATFIQRALDCIFHDVALQNLPVIICLDRAGAVEDGATHHGIHDIGFLRSIPNLSILSPKSEKELEQMLQAAHEHGTPTVIRYPKGFSGFSPDEAVSPCVWGRAELVRDGADLAVWATGREVLTACRTAEILAQKYAVHAAVINTRFLRPFDKELFLSFAERMPSATIEDHVKEGGLASLVSGILAEKKSGCRLFGLRSFGWDADSILPHGSVDDLRKAHGMTAEQIAEELADFLKNKDRNHAS